MDQELEIFSFTNNIIKLLLQHLSITNLKSNETNPSGMHEGMFRLIFVHLIT
jgi:hypothetical protein